MVVSNRERIGRAFEVLDEDLGPFVDHQMRDVHGEGWLESFVISGPRSSYPSRCRQRSALRGRSDTASRKRTSAPHAARLFPSGRGWFQASLQTSTAALSMASG